MSSSLTQLLSPCSEACHWSVPPEKQVETSGTTMLKIHALLNPSTSDYRYDRPRSASPPPTPAYTANGSTPASTPRPETPPTPSPTKRQKLIKDAAVFLRGSVKAPINYPPFECNEDSLCLNAEQRAELAQQHRRFQVFPSGHGDAGLISEFVRHIPYSSGKKNFLNKTGRDAFDGKQAVSQSVTTLG